MQEQSIGQYLKNLIRNSGMYGKLILINTIVFLFFLLIQIVEKLYINEGLKDTVMSWFAAPNLEHLPNRPWSIITQLFTHYDFGHFLFNMLMLFFIGRIFIQFFGGKRLLTTYLLGGVFAYLIHALAYYIFPVYQNDSFMLMGASGSIMAVFAAIVAYRPQLKVHLLFIRVGIPIFVIFGIYVLMDLIGMSTSQVGVKTAHFAHLGGALFGFLSVINVNSPKNFMNWIERFFSKFSIKGLFKRKPKMKVYSQEEVQQMDDDDYREVKAVHQKEIDAILDKISKKGYEGLTKKEKELLFNESKRKK